MKSGRSGHAPSHSSPFTLHYTLRELAEQLLTAAKSGPPTRETALTLLAADALITFACEAVAEEAPERLGEMT